MDDFGHRLGGGLFVYLLRLLKSRYKNMNNKLSSIGNWIKSHKLITVIVIIVFLIIIGSSGKDKTTTQVTTEAPQNKTEVTKETIKITSTKLVQAYIDNEVNGDNLYKGKDLEVSGTIKDIGKDILDTPYVIIESNPSDYFTQIQCMFKKDDAGLLASLKKGSSITIQGEGSGKLGNVLLRGCGIVQ